MEYKILIVERDAQEREKIANIFASVELKISIVEEKSVARSITHLLNTDINVLVLGPTLNVEELKKLHTCPSNFGQRVEICLDEELAKLISCKNVLKPSCTSEEAKHVIESAFDSEKTENQTNEDKSPKTNEPLQLAFVITKLIDRLNRISEVLKKQPQESKLKANSIPDAVNSIIIGATKIRQGKEQEDIKNLINELFRP